ncbi:MAG: carbohydrate ABC transporter permease [Vallitaleaceae bacterium]|nr:carbohydrate ABC transporter permease [Vallitaleaceae bacterium]
MKKPKSNLVIHVFFVIVSLSFLMPFLLVVSASFTDELALLENGYRLWPSKFSTAAYDYLFKNPKILIDAYKVTIFTTVVGTFASVFLMIMVAYSLGRRNCSFRKGLSFYIFFTMLFSGGLVPSYILVTQYLHLKDTMMILLLSGLISPFYIIVLRTFFSQLPESLFEAAKIDGASEFQIFFMIAIPLSKPAIATIAFMCVLGRWNDWYTPLLYITHHELRPLQYILYQMMASIQAILTAMKDTSGVNLDINSLPGVNLRMAMLIVAAGPVLVIFPFFQKYFTKGLTIGAVKG